jgi:hypothetical protein
MKFTTKKDKRTKVERLMDEQLEQLMDQAKTQKEVAEVLALIERREELKSKKKQLSPDTIAVIAGNLLGIILILGYERANVITTKALGFVIRGRV